MHSAVWWNRVGFPKDYHDSVGIQDSVHYLTKSRNKLLLDQCIFSDVNT